MQAAANPRKLLFALLLTMLISSRLIQSNNSISSPSPSLSPSPVSISRPRVCCFDPSNSYPATLDHPRTSRLPLSPPAPPLPE
ncbi:hypothetical protein FF1_043926 [Malus domestica]